jgi:Putative amidase domain
MSAYNRAGAVAYASLYWDKVCHDGCVGVQTETNRSVVPPIIKAEPGALLDASLFPAGMKGSDCTHFISCCIGKPGGGLSIGSWDCPPAYGILGTPALVRFLTAGGRAQIIKRGGQEIITEPEVAWDIVRNALEPADIIGYAAPTGYKHLVLHVGTGDKAGLIASHSHNAYGEYFDNIIFSSWTCVGYTFIHIL